MNGLVFSSLPTRRFKLPVKFEVYDPAKDEGFLDVLDVEIDVPVDRRAAAPVNGDYTIVTNQGDVRLTYWRVEDVDFAPFREATINCCSGMGYQSDDIQTKLDGLSFSGQYALPLRFDDVIDLRTSVHSITGRKYGSNLRYGSATPEQIREAGREVVDLERRSAAVREAASRCFLIREGVGLCMAAEPPIWGVMERYGAPEVRLSLVSPNRSRHDIFDLQRRDDAVAYARMQGTPEPEVGGEIHSPPTAWAEADDATLALAGEHRRFSRILSRNFSILDAEGIGFMHDCHQGARTVRGYGSAGDMLGMLDRIGASLAPCPDEREKWDQEAKEIRRRLGFEAGLSPAPIEGPRP